MEYGCTNLLCDEIRIINICNMRLRLYAISPKYGPVEFVSCNHIRAKLAARLIMIQGCIRVKLLLATVLKFSNYYHKSNNDVR